MKSLIDKFKLCPVCQGEYIQNRKVKCGPCSLHERINELEKQCEWQRGIIGRMKKFLMQFSRGDESVFDARDLLADLEKGPVGE